MSPVDDGAETQPDQPDQPDQPAPRVVVERTSSGGYTGKWLWAH